MVLGAGLSEGGIADCYSKAVSACNHKIFYPKESVLEFESIERQREDVYAYPVTMEQRLMNLIRRGSAAEVDDVLNKLVIELIASSGKSYPVLRTWVEGLYNSLKRMCISEGIIPNGISLIKHDFFWFSAEHLTKDTADFIGDIVRLLEGRSRINNPVIAKAVDHMLQNYKQEITLAGMAEAFNISPGYFSRLFKEETGVSFKNYLIGIRMEKAKALLLKSDAVISETAWEVGYSDPNYFSEAFRKFEGMSPSEYREANGIP